MSWHDDWEERQREIARWAPYGGLIEVVTGKVVNFRLTEPFRCEDREFCETWEGEQCNERPAVCPFDGQPCGGDCPQGDPCHAPVTP